MAPPLPKWWNWSCPIPNQPVSNSLIWVYKQLHTSPPQFSRLLHSAFISLSLIQLAAMRVPRWIPLQKLLDLDEKFQNEIPASLQPCHVLSAASLCQVWWQTPALSLASTLLGCGYLLNYGWFLYFSVDHSAKNYLMAIFIIIQPVQKKCQRSTPDVPHSLTSFYSFYLTNTSRHKINFEKVKNKKAKLARTAQMLKVRKGEWH